MCGDVFIIASCLFTLRLYIAVLWHRWILILRTAAKHVPNRLDLLGVVLGSWWKSTRLAGELCSLLCNLVFKQFILGCQHVYLFGQFIELLILTCHESLHHHFKIRFWLCIWTIPLVTITLIWSIKV